MSVRVPVLVVVAYVAMSFAWLFSNPPGSAPDETAHYVKALAAGHGRLHLTDPPAPSADPETQTPEQRWQGRTSRLVAVPARLEPSRLLCSAFRPEVSAACLLRPPPPPGPSVSAPTIVGTYQPYVYVVPGLLMRFASDPFFATRLGRLGFWLVSSAMIALAVFLLWSPGDGGYSLVGLMLAVTPMVVFMSSALSANGLEIGAGLSFLAAVIRLARGHDEPAWVWVATAVSGALLALARPTGVLWVGLAALVLVAMVGRRATAAILARGGRRAVAALVAVGAAALASVAWELTVAPHPSRSLMGTLREVPNELRELPAVYRQGIGTFGWLDTPMNPATYWAWTALFVVTVALALLVARRRQRWVLFGLMAATVGVTVGLAVLNRPTGFGVQARYVLAFAVVVPLVAGETLFAGRARLGALVPRWWPLLAAAVMAVLQLAAWYANARRYAVGVDGPRLFFADAEWRPPLGWVPWLVLTLVGAAALVTAALLATRRTAPA
ncbi:MAG: DUF2142 domain-containing protein [Acidimicrobiales bacterium]